MLKLYTTPYAGRNYFTNQNPVDVIEEKNAYKLVFDVPGFKKSDIELSLKNNVLTITGTKKTENKKLLVAERSSKQLNRIFELPSNIEPNAIEASMQDGVLTITIQKKENKSIKIM